jgi:hypothetical protein
MADLQKSVVPLGGRFAGDPIDGSTRCIIPNIRCGAAAGSSRRALSAVVESESPITRMAMKRAFDSYRRRSVAPGAVRTSLAPRPSRYYRFGQRVVIRQGDV